MIVKDSGYGAQMFDCTSKIKELEEQLAAAREAKQALAAKMTAFYTEEVGAFMWSTGKPGSWDGSCMCLRRTGSSSSTPGSWK